MQADSSDLGGKVFFGGLAAPPPSLTALLRATKRETLFDCQDHSGSLAAVVQETRDAMMALQKNALPLAACEIESRRVLLLTALLQSAETTTQRLRILGQLGDFRFLTSEPAESRKRKLTAVVRSATETELLPQATALAAIWRPEPGSILDTLIHRPTELGRMLTRRPVVSVIDHALDGLGEEGQQAFIKTGAICWRDVEAVHLVAGVGDFLHTCADHDSTVTPSGLTPLQLLLLHDELIDALRGSPNLEAPARHVVANAFIGCLSSFDLAQAMEDFFISWESRQAMTPAAQVPTVTETVAALSGAAFSGDGIVDDQEWMDCIISHEDLRPEAFRQRTHAEQREILREMFGDDWGEEDEIALETVAVAAV